MNGDTAALPDRSCIYQVGGSVRDALLGREPADRDFLIVGVTAEELVARGFRPVGRSFTVFLHPRTKQEYALPQNREGASGAEVGLLDDLARRDLTINAMAIDRQGILIDPFDGRADLQAGVLRHINDTFAQDPLRVLRVARFAAELGFSVAAQTQALMRELAPALLQCPCERLWKEVQRALGSPSPRRFIEVLRANGVLASLLPELERLFGVPQPATHHPEIDSGEHTLLALDVAAQFGFDTQVRFAVLLHDLGKGLTPQDQWPRHIGHEAAGIPLVEQVCARLGAPREYRRLAILSCAHHLRAHRALELRPVKSLALLEESGGFRNPTRFQRFLAACECDARGRLGHADRPYPQATRLQADLAAAQTVELGAAAEARDPAAWVREQRIRAIRQARGDAARMEREEGG